MQSTNSNQLGTEVINLSSRRLSDDEVRLLPTDEEVAFYREHGWYRSRHVLSDDVIDAAIAGSERYFRGERDWILPITTGLSQWKAENGDVMRNGQAVALQNRQLRDLVMQPILGAIAARLTGSSEIRYFDDSLIYKPAQLPNTESVVGWHTDRPYWGTCTSDEMLTVWIPFQDCPLDMGPVVYIDGSHKWPGVAQMRTFNSKDFAELEARFMADKGQATKYPMALKKGEVSFHSGLTVHGSEANRGSGPRIALAVHMQDKNNRFRPHLDNTGKPWHPFNDVLARKLPDGTPDYTDPEVFPVMWSNEW